jgi:signal transduction histidine kinase
MISLVKIRFGIVLVLLVPLAGYGQRNVIDSLQTLISSTQSADTVLVNRMNLLVYEYFKVGRYDSVYKTAQASLTLAKRLNYPLGEATALSDLGWYHYTKNNYQSAVVYGRKALKLYQAVNYKKGEGLALVLMANASFVQGYYDSARYCVDRAMDIFDKLNYQSGKASALSTLGLLYDLKSDSKNAISVYLQAIKIYDALGDKYSASLIYQSLAEHYRKQKQYAKAKIYLYKQLKYYKAINHRPNIGSTFIGLGTVHQDEQNYDSALYYYNQAQFIYENANDKYSLGIALNNIGDAYRLTRSFDRALKYYQRSLAICYEINDIEGTVYPLDGMGVIYTHKGNFSKAAEYLDKARHTAEALHVPHLISDNYLHTSQLDSARQNFKMAYHWHKKYSRVKDSLLNTQNSQMIVEMQTRFESEKKDQEINFLNEEKQIRAAQRERERNSLLVLLSISALLILALLYIVLQKIKTGRILRNQKNEITQKNEELNQMNEELKSVLETMEGQHQVLAEKNQKLEDLNLEKDGLIGIVAHDLRSPLTKTTGLVDLVALSGPLNAKQTDLMEMIRKVCDHGNSLIEDLLEINSLEGTRAEENTMSVVAVDSYLEAFATHHVTVANQKNITIHLEKSNQTKIDIMTNAEYLTRILDNIVSNAIKFSPPHSNVYLKGITQDNQVFFSVRDEGPGFSDADRAQMFKKFKRLSARPTGGESSTGLGLSIVKALVDRLKGNIIIETASGKGTTFTVVFPAYHLTYAPQE